MIDICREDFGFTLIEILVAMVIIIIGSLGVSSLAVSIMRGNSLNNEISTATLLGRGRLQDAQKLGYANVGNIAATENYNTITNYSSYRRETSVALNTPASNMKTVTVRVFWSSGGHSITLSTILAE